MRPSVVLDTNRIAVRETVARYRAANPRIFGPVPRGQGQAQQLRGIS